MSYNVKGNVLASQVCLVCVFLSFHSMLRQSLETGSHFFLFSFTGFESNLCFFFSLHESDTTVSHHSSSPFYSFLFCIFLPPKWDEMRGKLLQEAERVMQVFDGSVSVLLHITVFVDPFPLLEKEKCTKKDFVSYRQLWSGFTGERDGEKARVKGKSDKTVPDCLHVCWVFFD